MSEFFREFPIAIVGMACRLPGARDLKSYWKLIKNGESAIGELPESRLDRNLYYDPEVGKLGKTYSTLGGLIPKVRISPFEMGIPEDVADTTDEAHLVICDVALQAIRHAKMDPQNLKTRNVGVYVGGTGGSTWAGDLVFSRLIDETAGYLHQLPEFKSGSLRHLGQKGLSGVVEELVAGIRNKYKDRQRASNPNLAAHVAGAVINRAMGLTGPFMAIDAACASSIKAMVLGINAIQQGRLDMAIVGGASYCKADSLVLFSQAQSVSATSSRPFDSEADGLVSSEGYVVFVLKTLPRALADGDPIQAVIRSVGVATDGKGKSLWAPRKEGQILAIQRAYGENVDIQRLQYIEAHATATKVGDATELSALHLALKDKLAPGQRIALGTSKGNIGHTLETAGMAGMAKLILAMQNATIPPAINVDQLNTEFDWRNAPFIVPNKAIPWDEPKDGHQRRGAIDAFGIGGLNTHVVVDEYQKARPTSVYLSTAKPGSDLRRNEPIAVIGMGAIFPGAKTINEFWDLLISGRDAKTEVPASRWNKQLCEAQNGAKGFSGLGGFITDYEYDWKANKVPPKQIANANPLQFMLLDAAAQAFRQSGYDQREFDRKRVGVVVGTIFGGDFSAQLQMGIRLPEFQVMLEPILRKRGVSEEQLERVNEEFQRYFLDRMPALLDETGSFTSSTLASRITKTFDLMGGALALDAAECSGLAAVNAGIELLRSGSCDMMLCAGGHRSMDYTVYHSFWRAGKLADNSYPAFDERRDGIIPGEGVGVVLLKRLSDAQRDGDVIRSIIRGVGFSSNIAHPERTIEPAIKMAIESAQVSPSSIAASEMTGGFKFLERGELDAVAQVLGTVDRTSPIPLGCVAGQIGHCGGATGIASLLKATMTFENRQLPVGQRVEQPSSAVKEHSHAIRLPRSNEPFNIALDGQKTLINVASVSENGQTFDLIVEAGSAIPESPATPENQYLSKQTTKTTHAQIAASAVPRAVMLGGEDRESFLTRLNAYRSDTSRAADHSFTAAEKFRLALVVRDSEDLTRKLQLVKDRFQKSQDLVELEQEGIYFNALGQARVRMAWMFCGQGSQYAGMLRSLPAQYPSAAEAVRKADQALNRIGNLSFDRLTGDESQQSSSDLEHVLLSILLSQYMICESLYSLELRPEIVAGHSFGEYGALLAAKAWDLESAIACTELRIESIRRGVTLPGNMLTLSASFEAAEQLIREVGGNLFIANYNSLKQVVLSGAKNQIAKAAGLAREKGYASVVLPVTSPFHSPLMKRAADLFSKGLDSINIRKAQIPLVSTASANQIQNAGDLRKSLYDQLTMPVRYVEIVKHVVSMGPTLLVEIGPRQVLTKLHRSHSLQEAGHMMIATDNTSTSGLESLLRVKALAAVLGVLDAPSSLGSSSNVTMVPIQEQSTAGQFVHYDATARRKENHRRAALQHGNGHHADPVPHADVVDNVVRTSFEEITKANGNGSVVVKERPRGFSAIVAGVESTPVFSKSALKFSPVTSGSNGHYHQDHHGNNDSNGFMDDAELNLGKASQLQESELVEFLKDFVIEQTGYPAELVELDADLEADLGIDSIKKAQMMGEIGERFSLAPPTGNITLDSFATLQDVIRFMLGSMEPERKSAQLSPPQSERVNYVQEVKQVVVVDDARSLENDEDSGEALGDVAGFLIDFVIEQTGYPAELVDLDANLEADLGIDSIKKAQMLGEVGETFNIAPPGSNVTLDDFTTLRHVIAYIKRSMNQSGHTGSSGQENRVIQTAAKNAQPVEARQQKPNSNDTSSLVTDLKQFLIDFIIEQTGYPAELVDLDADLEADLGIDSIKKAQMLGEVGESFNIAPPSGNVTLDDFATLRQVLEYLKRSSNCVEHVPDDTPSQAAVATQEDVVAPPAILNEALIRTATSPESSRVMRRAVFRQIRCPLQPAEKPFVWGQRALIYGRNAASESLSRRLKSFGLDVVILQDMKTPEAASGAVEKAWKNGCCEHLFILSSQDNVRSSYLDNKSWETARQQRFLVPFVVCQKWFQLVTETKSATTPTLAAAIVLEGEQIESGSIEVAAISGLFKAAHSEAQGAIRSLVVDFAQNTSPDVVAEDLVSEIEARPDEIEVFYDKQRNRHVLRARHQPVSSLDQRSIVAGSTWIVTGGARGVVGYVAAEMGRRYGLKLHLVGSSEAPNIDPKWLTLTEKGRKQLKSRIVSEARQQKLLPAEAWQKVERSIEIASALQTLRELGAQVEYHCCDVSDRQGVAELVAAIRAKDGPINGVIHGAGIESACKFGNKKWPVVDRTLAVKVDGCAALMAAMADDPPKYFVGFASTSGRFGGVGQTDYSMANAMLVQLIANFRHANPGCSAFAIDWSAWGEIGMAARPESKFALQSMNLRFMPPLEGAEHLIDELQADGKDAEILILDHPGVFSSHPLMSDFDNSLDDMNDEIVETLDEDTCRHKSVSGELLFERGRILGHEIQSEIQSILALVVDRFDDRDHDVRLQPPPKLDCLRHVDSISELEGISSGAGVALFNLLTLREILVRQQPPETEETQSAKPESPVIRDLPLIDSIVSFEPGKSLVAASIVSPVADVFLLEHQLHRRPFLPAVVSIEILAEAASQMFPDLHVIEMNSIDLSKGHSFVSNNDVEMRTHVSVDGEVCFAKLNACFDNGSHVEIASAQVQFAKQPAEPDTGEFRDPVYGWFKFTYQDDWSTLYHGPSLRTFEEFSFQHDGGKAQLRARPPRELAGNRSGSSWFTPSALLDGCLVACGTYSFFMLEQRVEIPRSFQQLRWYRMPKDGEVCKLRLYLKHYDDRASHYDFILFGENGQHLIEARNFEMIRIEGGATK